MFFRSDKKPWNPTKYSKICSKHFVGGQKSDNPRNLAYNPTIFPPVYKKNPVLETDRAIRLSGRNDRKQLEGNDNSAPFKGNNIF